MTDQNTHPVTFEKATRIITRTSFAGDDDFGVQMDLDDQGEGHIIIADVFNEEQVSLDVDHLDLLEAIVRTAREHRDLVRSLRPIGSAS